MKRAASPLPWRERRTKTRTTPSAAFEAPPCGRGRGVAPCHNDLVQHPSPILSPQGGEEPQIADFKRLIPAWESPLTLRLPLFLRDRMATGTVREQRAAPCLTCRTGKARRIQKGPPKGASPLRDVASLHGGGVASATRLCCRRLRASRRAGGSPAEEEWTNWVRNRRAGRLSKRQFLFLARVPRQRPAPSLCAGPESFRRNLAPYLARGRFGASSSWLGEPENRRFSGLMAVETACRAR